MPVTVFDGFRRTAWISPWFPRANPPGDPLDNPLYAHFPPAPLAGFIFCSGFNHLRTADYACTGTGAGRSQRNPQDQGCRVRPGRGCNRPRTRSRIEGDGHDVEPDRPLWPAPHKFSTVSRGGRLGCQSAQRVGSQQRAPRKMVHGGCPGGRDSRLGSDAIQRRHGRTLLHADHRFADSLDIRNQWAANG